MVSYYSHDGISPSGSFSIGPQGKEEAIPESQVDKTKLTEKETSQKSHSTKETVKKTAEKVEEVGKNALGKEFVIFNKKGAVKLVWVSKSKIGAPSESFVYYTTRSGLMAFLRGRESELREEVEVRKKIKTALEDHLKDKADSAIAHLDIEIEELTGGDRIEGRYTLKVEKANGNFEEYLCRAISLEDRIKLGGDFLDGLKNLHLAGFNYNDLKPENCLIYEDSEKRLTLKLSDFGKATPPTVKLVGNSRFASPSGGDLYGAGLTLIRNFEELYLQQKGTTSLIKLEKGDKHYRKNAKEGIRGVEKYVVEHEAFKIADNPGALISHRGLQGNYTKAQKEAQDQAIFAYIDDLGEAMRSDLTEDQVKRLCKLLKEMTRCDPKITVEEAYKDYYAIFSTDDVETVGIEAEVDKEKDKESISSQVTQDSTSTVETSELGSKLKRETEGEGTGIEF